jgi:hypothetical protein
VGYLTVQYQLKSYLALNEIRGIQSVNWLGMGMKGLTKFPYADSINECHRVSSLLGENQTEFHPVYESTAKFLS